MVNSEYFCIDLPYDGFKAIEAIGRNSTNKQKECLVVKNCYHYHQIDIGLHSLLDLSLTSNTKLPINMNMPEIYFMHCQLWLEYLDKIGFNRTFDGERVRERVKGFKDQMFELDIKKR